MGLQLDEEEADKSQEEKWGKKPTIKMTRKNMQDEPELILSLLSIFQVGPRLQYNPCSWLSRANDTYEGRTDRNSST
jgi:hypothetical protein